MLDRLCSSVCCVSVLPSPSASGCNLTRVDLASQPTNYTEACAHPDAKRLVLHGRTGPVNGVEADGTLFVEDDAVAADAVSSKVLEPVGVAPEHAVALAPEPLCAAASQAVISRKSHPAAASQPSEDTTLSAAPQATVGPKLSAAASKPSADLKLSAAPSQPAADTTLLEVNTCMCICVACAALAWLLHGMCT